MKLYATIEAARGGREARKGDDTFLKVRFTAKQWRLGDVVLRMEGDDAVLVWLSPLATPQVLKRISLKGKTQQGVSCWNCGRERESLRLRCRHCHAR